MSRNVGICLPMMDMTDSWFTHDLYAAGVHHAFAHPEDNHSLIVQQSSIIPEARNLACKTAVEQGCEWIIMLDTDMRFPQDTFHRLMSWDKPVVAANCAKRRRPIGPTARRERADDSSKLETVWPDPEEHGLEQIATTGAAVMCIKADVLMEMEYPWFDTPWNDEHQRHIGEDNYFCARLKSAGIPLYLDHGLSWAIGHVGQYVYRMNDVLAERERARAGLWDHAGGPTVETESGPRKLILEGQEDDNELVVTG